MLNYIDIYELKNKFATFLCKLHFCSHIDLNVISHNLAYSGFFSYFEKNTIEDFINKKDEELAKELFGQGTSFTTEEYYNPALYWCGLQYISLSLNLDIPLPRVFLLCPINEMIEYFNVYHEMNNIEFIKVFRKSISKKSILKLLRKNRNLTVRKLSLLTSISEMTIKYYEKDNERLFKASYENISKFIRVLEINEWLIQEKSNFLPLSINTYKNQQLKNNILLYFAKYLDCENKENIVYSEDYKNIELKENSLYFINDLLTTEAKKELTKKLKNVVFLCGREEYYKFDKKVKITFINDMHLNILAKRAIEKTIEELNPNELLY